MMGRFVWRACLCGQLLIALWNKRAKTPRRLAIGGLESVLRAAWILWRDGTLAHRRPSFNRFTSSISANVTPRKKINRSGRRLGEQSSLSLR